MKCLARIGANRGIGGAVAWLAIGLFAVALGTGRAQETVHEFVLRDYLNRHWQNELVTYQVDFAAPGVDYKALRLYGPDGKPVAVQTSSGNSQAGRAMRVKVAFLASVKPFGVSTFRLAEGKERPIGGDVTARKSRRYLRLENPLVGVELAVRAKDAESGPIRGIKLGSGAWTGAGRLLGRKVTDYTAEITAEGPVFAEARCNYRFADGASWEIRFRVISGEPVVLVDERFDFEAPAASWRLQLNTKFEPQRLVYPRTQWKKDKGLAIPAAEGDWFSLAPWTGWWAGGAGKLFGLYGDKTSDLLVVATRNASVWSRPLPRSMDPFTRCNRQLDINVPLRVEAGRVELAFPFPRNGRARSWMIAALDANRDLQGARPAPPLQLFIKHGQIPLDQVKDYVLEWPGTEEHPRLFATKADLPRLRQRKTFAGADNDGLRYALTSDKGLGQKLAKEARGRLQAYIYGFTRYWITPKRRFEHRGQPRDSHEVHEILNRLDPVLTAPFLTAEDRRIMRAQAAFIAYRLVSEDIHSPARGWSANPNMVATWYSPVGMLGCMLRSHPEAQNWFDRAYREMRLELDTWAGPNGGWIEAPHYMSVAIDAIVGLGLAARNSGFSDFLYDPKLKLAGRYFARVTTPPDPARGNRRMVPAMGNTYKGETSALPGWFAKIWETRDPAYSAEMQWTWKQQGSMTHLGIGGPSPAFAQWRGLLLDPALPASAPKWETDYFPAVGVIFRSAFNSGRETYMFFRHGPFAEHFDRDEGSFILFGKGRPLMRDWGYGGGYITWQHNRVTNNHSGGGISWDEWAAVQAFAELGHADYARGRQEPETTAETPAAAADWPFKPNPLNGPMVWERQIMFVRHNDPKEPSYFVIADTTAGKTWMEWCAWFDAAGPLDVAKNPVPVVGRYDVDASVFFASPAVKRSTMALKRGGIGGPLTQQLLHLAQPAGAAPVVVALYPYVRGEEQPPQFTALGKGHGMKVAGKFGADWNIVSRRKTEVKDGVVAINAAVASVQDRAKRLTIALPEGGSASHGDYALTADGAASVDIAKGGARIVIRTDGRARQLRLRTPTPPDDWEETSQNAVRTDGKDLLVALPQGWTELRLTAPPPRK